ncbi:MAG TPA: guanylate kinase, partial [Geminicoccaceae bacterium]|nr:guanylate kinase [Geminicoccaceae bacterium]
SWTDRPGGSISAMGQAMTASRAPREPAIRRRGLMLVLSSPSGAGKTSIARRLLELEPKLQLSVSVTTRPPRSSEVDGVDYRFIDAATFAAMVAEGALLEHAQVYDHAYGTPRAAVQEALAAGRDVLFDIDWQGTQQLREVARDDMVSVFILPPSTAELERRLRRRAQDPEAVVRKRLAQVADDVTHWAEYDYVLINHDLDESVRQARAILAAERLRRQRQPGLTDFVGQFRSRR